MSAPEVSTTVPLMLPVVLNWPKAEGRNAPTHSEQTRNRALRRTVVNAAYVSFLCFTKASIKNAISLLDRSWVFARSPGRPTPGCPLHSLAASTANWRIGISGWQGCQSVDHRSATEPREQQ